MTTQSSPLHGSMLIGGKLVNAADGRRLTSINPATEEAIGSVPAAGSADVDAAVAAASAAAAGWAGLDIKARARHLRAIAQRIRDRAEEILRIEVMDTGNTIAKMRGDVESAGNALDYYSGLGTEMKGETIPASADNFHLTLREPYGVVARIIPFNHPIKFAANALAAPLMAGNTVVLKPPEQSPLSATVLAEICAELLPPGVVNILTGTGPEVGDPLVRHPAIRRLAFTGSVPTGMRIQRAAAEAGIKHVTLELGGKNPLIAYPDMDPARIAEVAVRGMNFAWQGQSCGSTSRLLLHKDIHDAVLRGVVERVEALKLGDPLDPASQMGPLNSKAHYERVLGLIEAGRSEGATLLTGGNRPKGEAFAKGFWLEPTVFGDVLPSMRIAREEIFGPVLSVFRWETEEEAFAIANDTDYGLTASIWTHDLNTALRAIRRVKSGYIWVNGASGHFYGTPFGGMKNSGLGREEGADELLSYTELKTAHLIMT